MDYNNPVPNFLFIAGQAAQFGRVHSIDNIINYIEFQASGPRIGPGLGGSGGGNVVIGTGIHTQDDIFKIAKSKWEFDFDLALGGSLGKTVKGAFKGSKAVVKLLELYKKLGGDKNAFLKDIVKNPSKYKEIFENITKNRGAITSEPNLIIISTPAGGGMHIFIGGQKSTIEILDYKFE